MAEMTSDDRVLALQSEIRRLDAALAELTERLGRVEKLTEGFDERVGKNDWRVDRIEDRVRGLEGGRR
jgi:hypothetical protein